MKLDAIKAARPIDQDEAMARIAGIGFPAGKRGFRWIFVLWLRRFLERRRYRRELPSLPDTVLEDFGLDRATAQAIADTPFWREEPETQNGRWSYRSVERTTRSSSVGSPR